MQREDAEADPQRGSDDPADDPEHGSLQGNHAEDVGAGCPDTRRDGERALLTAGADREGGAGEEHDEVAREDGGRRQQGDDRPEVGVAGGRGNLGVRDEVAVEHDHPELDTYVSTLGRCRRPRMGSQGRNVRAWLWPRLILTPGPQVVRGSDLELEDLRQLVRYEHGVREVLQLLRIHLDTAHSCRFRICLPRE